MKLSQMGKYIILSVTCLGLGIILGQMNMERAINLEGMKEAHLFGVHASYLRGCTENNSEETTWADCVQGAQNATKDVRDILDQNPELMHEVPQAPVPKPERGDINQQDLKKMLLNQKTILI